MKKDYYSPSEIAAKLNFLRSKQIPNRIIFNRLANSLSLGEFMELSYEEIVVILVLENNEKDRKEWISLESGKLIKVT